MAKTSFQITKRPPKAAVQHKIVRDEIRAGLNRVGKRTEQAYNNVVDNWKNKPRFKAEVGSGTKSLYMRIRVEGSRRVLDNWNRIDKTGAKPHTIRPKNPRGFLRFVWAGPGSYRAKTGANPARFGGAGDVPNGQVVYRRFVNHPGFKPRKFSAAINKAAVPEIDKEVRNATRRGLRKAKGS